MVMLVLVVASAVDLIMKEYTDDGDENDNVDDGEGNDDDDDDDDDDNDDSMLLITTRWQKMVMWGGDEGSRCEDRNTK